MQTVRSGEPECLSTQTVYHTRRETALTPCLKAGASAPEKVRELHCLLVGCVKERTCWGLGVVRLLKRVSAGQDGSCVRFWRADH